MRMLEGRMDLMRAAKWYHCPLSHEIDTRTAAHVYFTQVLYGACMLRKMEGMLYLFNGGVPFRFTASYHFSSQLSTFSPDNITNLQLLYFFFFQ